MTRALKGFLFYMNSFNQTITHLNFDTTRVLYNYIAHVISFKTRCSTNVVLTSIVFNHVSRMYFRENIRRFLCAFNVHAILKRIYHDIRRIQLDDIKCDAFIVLFFHIISLLSSFSFVPVVIFSRYLPRFTRSCS